MSQRKRKRDSAPGDRPQSNILSFFRPVPPENELENSGTELVKAL